jgi:hypothetical protein
MIGLFKRTPDADPARELGRTAVALPLRDGAAVPPGCAAVIADAQGRTRRVGAPGAKAAKGAIGTLGALGARGIALRDGEQAWAVHPGPYTVDLVPFAAAPEIGLRTTFAIVAAGPEVAQQRFDLLLAAEVADRLDLARLAGGVEAALRRELSQGGLSLPPCTTIEEWNAFRLGFNELLYMRFGLTADDCVPVDLAPAADLAAVLAARARQPAAASAVQPSPAAVAQEPAPAAARADPALSDARALRRLFLELPCLMCGLRLGSLPADPCLFHRQQALLQRLDLLSVGVATMPALALAAPGQPVPADARRRRAACSVRATDALDEAWALLARLKGAPQERLAALYDEADRIVANLELDCAARRASGDAAAGSAS